MQFTCATARPFLRLCQMQCVCRAYQPHRSQSMQKASLGGAARAHSVSHRQVARRRPGLELGLCSSGCSCGGMQAPALGLVRAPVRAAAGLAAVPHTPAPAGRKQAGQHGRRSETDRQAANNPTGSYIHARKAICCRECLGHHSRRTELQTMRVAAAVRCAHPGSRSRCLCVNHCRCIPCCGGGCGGGCSCGCRPNLCRAFRIQHGSPSLLAVGQAVQCSGCDLPYLLLWAAVQQLLQSNNAA